MQKPCPPEDYLEIVFWSGDEEVAGLSQEELNAGAVDEAELRLGVVDAIYYSLLDLWVGAGRLTSAHCRVENSKRLKWCSGRALTVNLHIHCYWHAIFRSPASNSRSFVSAHRACLERPYNFALCRDRTWSSGLWLSSRFSNLSEPFARHAGALWHSLESRVPDSTPTWSAKSYGRLHTFRLKLALVLDRCWKCRRYSHELPSSSLLFWTDIKESRRCTLPRTYLVSYA